MFCVIVLFWFCILRRIVINRNRFVPINGIDAKENTDFSVIFTSSIIDHLVKRGFGAESDLSFPLLMVLHMDIDIHSLGLTGKTELNLAIEDTKNMIDLLVATFVYKCLYPGEESDRNSFFEKTDELTKGEKEAILKACEKVKLLKLPIL